MDAASAETKAAMQYVESTERDLVGYATSFMGWVRSAPKEEKRQPMKVIGAGWGRTGTSSMLLALRQLGFKSYHMLNGVIGHGQIPEWAMWAKAKAATLASNSTENREELERQTNAIIDLLASTGFNATVDAPAFMLYKELADKYPDAKVVLTVRESPEAWADSVLSTVGRSNGGFWTKRPYSFLKRFVDFGQITDILYRQAGIKRSQDDPKSDREALIKGYETWNAKVKETIPKERLLVHEASQGWGPLCEFLDVDNCPKTPYPHVNDSRTLSLMFDAFELLSYVWWVPPAALLFVYGRRRFKSTFKKEKTS